MSQDDDNNNCNLDAAKEAGANGLQPAERQKALLHTCSLLFEEVKDNTRLVSSVTVQLCPRCQGQADSIFDLSAIRELEYQVTSPQQGGGREQFKESSQGPTASL
jgi:hypothetical protein